MSFSVNHLSLSVGRKVLLDNLSFSINPGELVVVLGPNGAGKSSLLKVMSGEHSFSEGDMQINGASYRHWSVGDIARMVGVLPQSSQLVFPFTVLEVVMLGRLPHSSGRVRDAEIVKQVIDRVDMTHLMHAAYPSLSGGEKQRVQLARVLAQIWEESALGARYLLLDEPTSALDVAHQQLTLQLARELAGKGIGVMAILHDLNLAAQYGDRIVMLRQGAIAAQGSVEEILKPELIRQLFAIDVSILPHPVSQRPMVVML
ncbi:heme ABC transporter ATP-binding protein [Neptunomonas antarctica]|uniref:Iron complex transport system ATP-binding protein n=1 Tax=Neptunomonas antarctica TaxID=619304 RepID=A0A1N7LGB0_9GAMM|nr:heme ABC transporter ATP-binding protein [Neptunomonas antarctica]SIS72855.1 iron complex transport system ATP-binding protein [Neptunomonas antarctica]